MMTEHELSEWDVTRAISVLHEITQCGQVVEFTFGPESRWCISTSEGWRVVHESRDGAVTEVETYQRPEDIAILVRACDEFCIRGRHEWPEGLVPEPFDPRGNVAGAEARR